MGARKTVQPGNKVEIIKKPGGIGIVMPGRPSRPGQGGPAMPGGVTRPTPRPIGGC